MDPDPTQRLTAILNDAAAGSSEAWERMYEMVENTARHVAGRAIRKAGGGGRVRVTEIIDDVLVDLIPPLPGTAAASPPRPAQHWPNRAYFYASVGRRSWQLVIDLLRDPKGGRDRNSVADVVAEAVAGESPGPHPDLTPGDAAQVSGWLARLIARDEISRRILKVGGDPSEASAVLRVLLHTSRHAPDLPPESPAGVGRVVGEWLRSDVVRRRLTLVRTAVSLEPSPADTGASPVGAGEPAAARPHLTVHSLLTLHEVIDDIDDKFANDDPAVPVTPPREVAGDCTQPLNTQWQPPLPVTVNRPRSLYGQIIYLLLIGWKWHEIAGGLGRPLSTVHNRWRTIEELLRRELGDQFFERVWR